MALEFLKTNGGDVLERFRGRVGRLRSDEELSRRLAETIGGMMHDRCLRMQAPDGTAWKPNAPSTVRRKGHGIVGIDSGEMLRRSNFTSDYGYQVHEFVLRYSGPVERLGYFEGNNRYGTVRKAWGMTPEIKAAAGQVVKDRFKEGR